MPRARTPASRLASGLMPTASVSTPSAVRRSSSARIVIAATRDEEGEREADAGSRSTMKEYGALLTVVMKPSVMSSATPRPASMSTSVAMMGWMPRWRRGSRSMPRARARRRAPTTSDRHGAEAPGVGRPVDDRQRDRARDGHDGADREVDAAGGDDDRHAERDQHERGAVAQDVDERAVELAVPHRDADELRARRSC